MPNGRLLVVENDRTTASIIKMFLEKCDYQVVDVVNSGDNAIRSTAENDPDLVLMDIRLEGEVDGITAADRIISELQVPVVYVTAHNDEEVLDRARGTAHSGFINKPLREVDLRTTINFAVNSKRKKNDGGKVKKTLSVSELMDAYGLTKSESNLVTKLLKNPDLNAISEESYITVNTIRTHLKHIYRKTRTGSKAELLMKVVNEFDCG